jgi:membrane protein implicated in regulation of membrane protease activity
VALGIVLILVGVAGFAAFILWGATDPATVDILGLHAETTSLVVFLSGAVAAALVLLGLRLLLNGFRRDVRRRRKTRELKQQAESATRAAEEASRAAEQAKEKASKPEHTPKRTDESHVHSTPESPPQP